MKDGDPANTGNPVEIFGVNGQALTPCTPAPNVSGILEPCFDVEISFAKKINYFSILVLDTDLETTTALGYRGPNLVETNVQGSFVGN